MALQLSDDPAELGWVVTRSEALAAGLTQGQIRTRLQSGRWTSLLAGTYVRTWALPALSDRFALERRNHVLMAVSAARLSPECVLAYATASTALGLPLVSPLPRDVQLAVPQNSWAGRRRHAHRHRLTLEPRDIAPIDVWEIAATTPARTVVDVARLESLADALSVGDRALREGAVTREQLAAVLERTVDLRGGRRAVEAVILLDGNRETALESLSFARFVEWGIPLPVMQHEFWDDEGFVARVDFWWPEFGLVGEADGRVKYADRPDAMWLEKRRELRLQRLGLRVVRWVWSDVVSSTSPFRSELARCFTRAA